MKGAVLSVCTVMRDCCVFLVVMRDCCLKEEWSEKNTAGEIIKGTEMRRSVEASLSFTLTQKFRFYFIPLVIYYFFGLLVFLFFNTFLPFCFAMYFSPFFGMYISCPSCSVVHELFFVVVVILFIYLFGFLLGTVPT